MNTKNLLRVFVPNAKIEKNTWLVLIVVQVAAAILLWSVAATELIPSPIEVVEAFGELLANHNLIGELTTSFLLCVKSIFLGTLLSVLIAYSGVMPFFKNIAGFGAKMRFMTLVGLSFIFALTFTGGHSLKLALLIFGISGFQLVALNQLVASVSRNEYNHAKALGMSKWGIVWEVVFKGRLHDILEITRQNLAISWTMLTFVEGLVRSEGGIGLMLQEANKHLKLDHIFAVQLCVLVLAVGMDRGLLWLKHTIFPYSNLTTK
jgi:NitT/TauT family transport system permease protein